MLWPKTGRIARCGSLDFTYNLKRFINSSGRLWETAQRVHEESPVDVEPKNSPPPEAKATPMKRFSSIGSKPGWKAVTHLPYIRFDNLEASVRQEIVHSANENRILLDSLPRFSRIINGLRPGELTVFTGPTGCGKTTVLSQMSLDYAVQGTTVLWGSFEIRNTRLAQVMLQQLAAAPLQHDRQVDFERFDEAASKLRIAPVHFMNLFGSTGLDTVLSTMELSMREGLKPNLIILDNLQFMLSGQAATSLDRWELMDRAISSIRYFCNTFPVHIILVIHPRKELDDTPLCLASISGTAKATQEADNVIILQKLGDRRYLDVKKNRYHGDLGRVRVGFIPEARIVVEMSEDEDDSRGRSSSGYTSSQSNNYNERVSQS